MKYQTPEDILLCEIFKQKQIEKSNWRKQKECKKKTNKQTIFQSTTLKEEQDAIKKKYFENKEGLLGIKSMTVEILKI